MNEIEDLIGKTSEQLEAILGFPCPVIPEDAEPDDTRYVDIPERGMSIVIGSDGTADTVQLFGPGRDPGYAMYRDEFHPGLGFHSSREEVRARLGSPVTSEVGGPGKRLFGEYLDPWDLFDVGVYRIHFEYTRDASAIQLVSISAPSH